MSTTNADRLARRGFNRAVLRTGTRGEGFLRFLDALITARLGEFNRALMSEVATSLPQAGGGGAHR